MTIEEQRYLEECKKVLKHEQMDIVTMAMDYGLPIAGNTQGGTEQPERGMYA